MAASGQLIVVTGATGFVGGRLVSALSQRGHEVIAFGRRPAPMLPNYQRWDISVGPIDPPRAVDAVVHCAGLVSDWGSPSAFVAANVIGTRHVLQSFAAAPRFVYVSTASVYDPASSTIRLTEAAPYARSYLNNYARTKMLAECEIRGSGRPSIILRPHAVYGPGDTTLLPRLLAARRFGHLLMAGNGRNVVSITHVDNLVQAIVRAIEGPLDQGIFNIADALTAPLDTVLRTLLRRLGLPQCVVYVPRAVAWPAARALDGVYRSLGLRHAPLLTPYMVRQLAHEYTLDITAARRVLGYVPTCSYLDGPLTGDEEGAGMLQSCREDTCHSIHKPLL